MTAPVSSGPVREWPVAALALALFCMVVGARWIVIARYGTDLPMMDAWDALGLDQLAPWFAGTWSPHRLLDPHNEHRVILTKLLNLSLALINHQWDQRLETTLNAFFPGALAVLLFVFGCRHFAAGWRPALWLFLAVLYALPLAWESVVRGFDSQEYFVIGFSVGAIVLLPAARPGAGRWWLGAGCLLLALASMASGFFAGLVVLGLLALRQWRGEGAGRAALPAAVVAALAVATGVATRVVVPENAVLMAHGGFEFVVAAARSFGWPAYDPWLGAPALLLWAPWLMLAMRLLVRDGRRATLAEYGILGLGAWAILQILASAYARGAGGPPPASRYIDNLLIGLFANAGALILAAETSSAHRHRALWGGAGVAWLGLLGYGLAVQLPLIVHEQLPASAQYDFYSTQNVRHFLATGDRAYLEHAELPYPGTANFWERLRLPALQALLPAGARAPLALREAPGGGGFVRSDARAPQAAPPAPPAAPGLAPNLPSLTNEVVWGSFGRGAAGPAAAWRSEPLRATLPGWLAFAVAGDLGAPGTALELRDAATDRLLASVRRAPLPGAAWHLAYAPAPAGAFVLVARAEPGRWFAFAQPVEMGRLSYLALRALKLGPWLVGLGVGTALLTMGCDCCRSRISRAP